MPRVDFGSTHDINDYSPIPDGEYLVRVVDVETDSTRSGDEMWKLRLQVEGGEHAGRLLFDNMIFSPKAMPRVKLMCGSFGLDVTGILNLDPTMVLQKQAFVTVYQETYEDNRGQEKVANRVAYDGYGPVPGHDTPPPF